MRLTNARKMLPLVLGFAIAGCGEGTGPGISVNCGITGTASGSVSGAVTANLGGCALYFVTSGSGGSITTVSLNAGSISAPTHSVSLQFNSGRPATGTYTFGTGANGFGGAFKFEAGSSDRTFIISSGTVTITGSSANTLSGTMTSIVATEVTTAAPTVTITGTFSAKCTAVSGTTC